MSSMNRQKRVSICWSGGKDSCLSLYHILREKHEVVCLLSMVSEKYGRNHAHGIRLELLKMQAKALGLPLILVDSAGEYEKSLKNALLHLKERYDVESIAFGSLYMQEDREWNEQIAIQSGLEPLFPVWISKDHSSRLLHDFISLGFQAVTCRASEKLLDNTWAGRMLDWSFYEDIHKTDCCVMGEMGEYHTFVLDGPIFHKRLEITTNEVVLNAGLWSLDIKACELMEKN